ncbi:hypothetical protein [Microbacterium sp.]|uniref:DUF4190 domain-containing protein n=1 Tax=Microbacterium sp. TaxID=51671 RepID=UPI0035660448
MTIQNSHNTLPLDPAQPERQARDEGQGPMPPQAPTPTQPLAQPTPQAQVVPQPIAYQPQPAAAPSNGVALTAMILGIVGAVAGFWAVVPITGYFSAAFGFPLAVAAVICGHIGRARSKRVGGVGRIQALVGFLLGYVSIAVMVIASAAWTVFLFIGSL